MAHKHMWLSEYSNKRSYFRKMKRMPKPKKLQPIKTQKERP
jgi:hypothetical protein